MRFGFIHHTRRRHRPLAECSTRHFFNRSILSSWHAGTLALSGWQNSSSGQQRSWFYRDLGHCDTTESGTHSATRQSREVFMAGQPPQIPMPNPPDIQDGEEALSDISPDTAPRNVETDEQKTARKRKNRAQQAQCNHTQHYKEEW